MFLLVLLFACDDTTMAPTFNAKEISLPVKYQEMEKGIRAVLDDWEQDNRHKAREKLLEIFHGSFQDFQPFLARNDRLGMIQVEWTFGQTLHQMKALQRKGRKEQGEKLLQQLHDEVHSLPEMIVPEEKKTPVEITDQ